MLVIRDLVMRYLAVRYVWLCLAMFMAGLLGELAFVESSWAKPADDKGAGAKAALASQSNVCIPANIMQQFESQCSRYSGGGTIGGARTPRGVLPGGSNKKSSSTGGTRKPSFELDVATRLNKKRTEARAWNLLQREVQVLTRLVQNTPTRDNRRPDILLRLAETYFEMQQHLNTKVRSYDEPMYLAKQKKDAGRYNTLKKQQQDAQKHLDEARTNALRTYALLIKEHPDYPRMDEVLFSLAFGLEEQKQFDKARQVYLRLIKEYPQSRFIPHAYLSFAEFFFTGSDMKAAIKFYDKVLEYPPERNAVYGYAIYKQAWAYYNTEDFKNSLKKFADVIEYADSHPEAKDAKSLAKQARRELVLPYAQIGQPSKALAFFTRYAKAKNDAFDMLESLGEAYFDTGKWDDSIIVYHELIDKLPTSDKVCEWEGKIANAVISSKGKGDQVREAQRLIELQEVFSKQSHPKPIIAACRSNAASVLIELAIAWHRESVGTEASPGTNDAKTMRAAAALYKMAVEKFPDMDRMEFPNFDRRDWPTRYRIAYYSADLSWKQKDWAQCGPAFDKNLYQQRYESRERELREGAMSTKEAKDGKDAKKPAAPALEPRSFSQLEEGMLRAFDRYICVVKKSDELPKVKYRRARIYYEANRFEEAAAMFKDIAWNHRNSDLAEFAANLYLDSLNVLSTVRQPPKPACLTQMTDDVQQIAKLYCNSPESDQKYADLCPTISSLECGLLRKKAEADQTAGRYKNAAYTYVRIFKRYRSGAGECSGRMDEVLYNAAINFEAARLLGRAIQVRKFLIKGYPDSVLAKKAIYLIGANYHALAIYSSAADYYEDFAKKYSGELGKNCSADEKKAGTCTIAPEALKNAVFFRLATGEEEKAVDDVRLFGKNYQKILPRETTQVFFSLGSLYDARGDRMKSKEHYEEFLKRYKKQALPHQVIRSYVQIARAFWEANDKTKAEAYFKSAVKEWNSVSGKLAKLDLGEGKELAVFEAKNAASEAIFYLAELKYNEFRRIKFPEYSGGRDLMAVNKWSKNKFLKWVLAKQQALKATEAEYNKIAEIEVPEWMIASAARIGEMYVSFIDAFREAPVPTEIERDDELYGIYVDALENEAKKYEKPAIDKFEFCLLRATKVRWFNKWSQQCESELNRLNPAEYPIEDELRGGATYAQRVVARPGALVMGNRAEEAELEASP